MRWCLRLSVDKSRAVPTLRLPVHLEPRRISFDQRRSNNRRNMSGDANAADKLGDASDQDLGRARKYAGEEVPENMTKSAFKRLKKMQRMEADREEFMEKRRQKRREQRKRNPTRRKLPRKDTQEPSGVSVVIDCGYDEYMTVPERTSLAGQSTRCYSENRRSSRPVDLIISGFNGESRSRFENEMHNQHRSWSGITFVEGDHTPSSTEKSHNSTTDSKESVNNNDDNEKGNNAITDNDKICQSENAQESGLSNMENAIYLTGDAEDILTELEPGKTYYVGGIVDKNRYVNLCLNKAKSMGMRTAKLPIDEHIKVSGRRVLTTNQAFESSLRWLELRDWKAAFEAAIPSRKLIGEDMKSEELAQTEKDALSASSDESEK